MRAVDPKKPIAPQIKMTPGPPNKYGDCFAAVARCKCGHDAQLPQEWVRMAAMYGKEKEQARARLRCSKCGCRMPRVEVYRVPS
jgi:hypothetical protein